MVNLRKIMAVFLLLTLVAGVFSGCKAEESKNFQTLEDFKQAKIGVITGSSHDKTVKEILPDAERIYFSSMADMIIAVEQEKIDGYIEDAPFVAPLMWEGMPLRTLEEPVSKTNSGFVFPQSEDSKALREEINEFLTEVKADGTADRLIQKWTGDTEPTDVPDYASLSGENGTIRLAISVDNKPILYQQGSSYTGFEMELLTMFGQKMGYAFDIEVVPFESIIAGMAAGKYDMGASSLNITPEREENVDFSIPYASFNVVLVCKGEKKESAGDHAQVDLNNATIGLVTGTSWDIVAQRDYPNAQRMYFGSDADVLMALSQDKVDVFFADNTVYTAIRWENDEYIAVGDPIEYVSGALIFAKTNYDENLMAQVNEYIAKARADGTLDRLAAKWFADEEPAEHPDYTKLTGANGTLRIAVGNASKPLSYQKGSMYSGYEVEFLTLFAEVYGYKLDLQGMTFDALIPTVSSGKCDMGACGINITPDRAETVTFSDSHIEAYGVVVVCAEPAAQSGEMTLADLNTGTIGVVTGTSWDQVAQRQFPNAERKYFVTSADALLALEQGKIDAFFADKTVYAGIRWENSAIDYIDEPLESVINALIFGKEDYDENLLAQVNEYIAKARADGTLERLEAKWFADAEPAEHPDYTKLTGKNGTIRVAVSDAHRPVVYQRGTMYTGYEVDFLTLFAEEYGYQLDFQGMAFDALIPTVASGKCDIGACGITITPERAENVTFSDPHIETYGVAVISAENAEESRALTLADFKTAKIGIMTGSSHDGTAKEMFPNAERVYFNTVADMVLAAEQGKIQGYIEDAPFLVSVLWEGADVKRLEESIKQVDNGFAFPQSEDSRELREQLNAFIAASKADGTLDALLEKWFADTEPTEHPDYLSLTGENGTIRLAVTVENKPAVYLKDNLCTGFEMEFLTRFAREYGYKFEIEAVPFGSVIAGIAAGKYDMASASLNITAEREESVDFSDPYAAFDVVMVTRNTVQQTTGKTLNDFENAKIGVHTGTVFDDYAKERFPNASRTYFNQISDMIVAVEQGKIDGYISESTYVTAAIWEGAEIEALPETLDHTHAGYIFPKGEQSAQLRQQLDAFIRKAKENGTVDTLMKKWTGKTEPTETPDYKSLTGENGTIKVAVAPDLKPVTYIKDGEPTGYEIEILTMFAKEYGYKLDFAYMTFDAILPGVTTGKYDIGTGAVTITEERAESVDFSESHLTVDVVMVVSEKAEEAEAKTGFWSDVKESFEKTFIREDRWKLILEGIGVTMLISVSAAVLGTLLGFGLYMLSRSDVKLIQALTKGVAKVYSRIIAGTPVVVILMILFYVIFGKIRDMSGVVVAIIGFTLTFGAFVYDHMTVSVGSVDPGQTEAAYALGYTKNQTFFRIIFPQAMSIFLPSYCGQAVELIKATAVVGYIAVNDLTKMGDIIRSNTYEAFFPLIATAVIYFLLTWMLSALLGLVKRRFEPKRRSKEDILKGVKTV